MKRLVVLTLVTLAGTSWAEPVVLQPHDSLTVDGTKYTCEAPTRHGVQLAAGDHVTAGTHEIRCEDDAAAAPATVAIESSVDPLCIDGLYEMIDGQLPPADALGWAASCRGFQIGRACTVASSDPDEECMSALERSIIGTFSADDLPRVTNACKRITASCPALPNEATSEVDADCLNQLYQATPGKPSAATAIAWTDACRPRAARGCVAVGGTVDRACTGQLYQMIDGKFSPRDAAAAARACRTIALRCP